MVKKCSLGKALFKNIGSPLILIKAKAKFNQNLRRSIHYELFLKQSQKKVGKIKGDLPGARSQVIILSARCRATVRAPGSTVDSCSP